MRRHPAATTCRRPAWQLPPAGVVTPPPAINQPPSPAGLTTADFRQLLLLAAVALVAIAAHDVVGVGQRSLVAPARAALTHRHRHTVEASGGGGGGHRSAGRRHAEPASVTSRHRGGTRGRHPPVAAAASKQTLPRLKLSRTTVAQLEECRTLELPVTGSSLTAGAFWRTALTKILIKIRLHLQMGTKSPEADTKIHLKRIQKFT